MKSDLPLWTSEFIGTSKKIRTYRNIFIVSMTTAFAMGLIIGFFLPSIIVTSTSEENFLSSDETNDIQFDRTLFHHNFNLTPNYDKNKTEVYNPVKFVEGDGIIEDGIYWGHKVENLLPKGFTTKDTDQWVRFVDQSMAVRLEPGCGRMQNRMVVFQDGTKGCVRYRQNLDQIQGEQFSFFLAQILQLPNLAPSTLSLVDLQAKTWKNLATEISAIQWNANRPIVVTKFIPDLNSANIPLGFRPPDRHLNQQYIFEKNKTNPSKTMSDYVELAQWSDLVVFDYLTANLDRVVNNLYNKQWNVNIMEAPAHNLARKSDNLLVFLDNESGLLHGYRLLHKYEPYHSMLLDNLCIFRKQTISIIERLKREKNVGKLLVEMFVNKTKGNSKIRDFLSPLPDKSIKVLNDRIEKVYAQVVQCRRNVLKSL